MKKKTKSLKKSNIDVKKKTIPLFLGIVIVILVFILIVNSDKVLRNTPETEEVTPVEDLAREEIVTGETKPIDELEEITLIEDGREEVIPEEENIIEIREDSFYPIEKIVKKNTEIRWVNKDTKQHKIACYLGGNRVTTSSNLDENDYFTYTFIEGGEYTCIDAIYGLRSIITIESQQPLLSPIGSAVIGGSNTLKGASLSAIALIALIVLLFFIYGRKRR